MSFCLTSQDLKDFGEAEMQILTFMRPGQWVTEDQLIKLTGQRQALRRMRELRKKGIKIEVKRFGDKRDFRYRIVK